MDTEGKSGRIWRSSGVALAAVGFVFFFVLRTMSGPGGTVFALMGVLALIGGAFLYWRGRKLEAHAASVRILKDGKPDVLYLRAFQSDANFGRSMSTMNIWAWFSTEEEQLAEVLRPMGDLVAIGRPGERLPLPGAARIYVADDAWKGVVDCRMRAARLVVIRAGVGENLLWELEHAVKILDPRKLVLLFFKMKKKDYEAFRNAAIPILGVPIPAVSAVKRFRKVSGFVGFAGDWKQPRFYACRAPYFRKSVFKPHRPLFQFALRPVFESLGMEWKSPPVSKLTVTGVSVMGLFLFLCLLIVVAAAFQ